MLIASNNNAVSTERSARRQDGSSSKDGSALPAPSTRRELSDYLPAEIAQGTTPERYAEIVERMVHDYQTVKRRATDLGFPEDARRLALDFGILTAEELQDYDDSRNHLYRLCRDPSCSPVKSLFGLSFLGGLSTGSLIGSLTAAGVGAVIGAFAGYFGEIERTKEAIQAKYVELPCAAAKFMFHLTHIAHQLEDHPIDPERFKPGMIPRLEKTYEGRLGTMITSLTKTKEEFKAASAELEHVRIEPYGLKIVMMRGEL